MTDFMDATEKIGILLATRADVAKGVYKLKPTQGADTRGNGRVPKFPTVKDPRVKEICRRVNEQLPIYRGRKGIFAREYLIDAAEKMPSHLWWEQYGSSMP